MSGADDPGFVYFVEARGRGIFLRGAPIDVSLVLHVLLLGLLGVMAARALRRGGMKTMLPALLAAAACGGRASAVCTADPAPADSAVLLDLALDARAGQEPFAIGKTLTSAAGDAYRVSTLRFYVSHLQLVNDQGVAVPAVLADATGTPSEYGASIGEATVECAHAGVHLDAVAGGEH